MTIKVHNLEEMKDYYNKETNTYCFCGDDGYTANVVLYFDLKVIFSFLNGLIFYQIVICLF